MKTRLNNLEKRCLEKTVDLWLLILELETIHPDDIDYFRKDIHSIQDRIHARPERRLSP